MWIIVLYFTQFGGCVFFIGFRCSLNCLFKFAKLIIELRRFTNNFNSMGTMVNLYLSAPQLLDLCMMLNETKMT